MSSYEATVVWTRDGADFLDNRYSRRHLWQFDGGAEVIASSSPQVVPVPMSSESAVDPEEAFVASLSSFIRPYQLSGPQHENHQIPGHRLLLRFCSCHCTTNAGPSPGIRAASPGIRFRNEGS